jgi:hypothetical protein
VDETNIYTWIFIEWEWLRHLTVPDKYCTWTNRWKF